jgi:hypothetical protein
MSPVRTDVGCVFPKVIQQDLRYCPLSAVVSVTFWRSWSAGVLARVIIVHHRRPKVISPGRRSDGTCCRGCSCAGYASGGWNQGGPTASPPTAAATATPPPAHLTPVGRRTPTFARTGSCRTCPPCTWCSPDQPGKRVFWCHGLLAFGRFSVGGRVLDQCIADPFEECDERVEPIGAKHLPGPVLGRELTAHSVGRRWKEGRQAPGIIPWPRRACPCERSPR